MNNMNRMNMMGNMNNMNNMNFGNMNNFGFMNNNMQNSMQNLNSNINMNNSNNNINNQPPTSLSTGNINLNNNNNQRPKEVLPRGNQFIKDNTHFPADVEIKNVRFEASTGSSAVIKAPKNTSIKEIVKLYVKRLGLSEDVIGKDLVFLFCGEKLDTDSEEAISKFPDMASITVFDQNNVIGA